MKTDKKTLLVIYLFFGTVICNVVREEYKGYPSKRLMNNVIKTVMTSSAFHCTTWCSMTDGCLAVNVIGNHEITCELTRGLSMEDEMQDELSSQLFVANYNKCNSEPEYCLNNATCEKTWTSARCLCSSRFQGALCDSCSERFQGNGCQECKLRFQGDECQQCSARFQGSDCQQCAQNYYGNNCEYSFTSHSDHSCNVGTLDTLIPDNSGSYDNCKEECIANNNCGGFTVHHGICSLKDTNCENNMKSIPTATLFLKNVN